MERQDSSIHLLEQVNAQAATIADLRKQMEVDGEFWHHSAWAHENDVPYRDMEKERWALEHGYGFVRLDEPTVLHDNLQSALEECFQKGGPKCY